MAELCGIKAGLTYHVARHSAATTVMLSNGVPIETVSRLLGHTNIKTTQIYAKITAQKISQDMENSVTQVGKYGKEYMRDDTIITVSRIFPRSSIEVSTYFTESEKVRRLCRFGQNLPLSERIQPENLFPFTSVQWTMTATETND